MSDSSTNDELDSGLRQLAREQAESAPPAHGWSAVMARADHQTTTPAPTRRRWAAAAAASIVVTGIGALIVVDRPDRDQAGDDDVATQTVASVTSPATSSPGTTAPTTTMTPEVPISIAHDVLVDGAPSGPTWTTALATDTDGLIGIWAAAGLADALPTVDFSTHVVVWFAPAESSSCPFLPLQRVEFNPRTGRLYPVLEIEGGPVCAADANPHAIVVAIARAALPAPPFDIWVDSPGPRGCCRHEVTHVTAADLALDAERPASSATIPPGPIESTFEVPTGSFSVGADDLFVAHADGDLWLHPGILGDSPGEPVRVADLTDPREPVTEGPGPNVVEQVAGVANGSVIYSDCCEPIAGNVFAATGPGSVPTRVSFGSTPALTPDARLFASAQLSGVFVGGISSGIGRLRDLSSGDQFRQVLDLAWLGDDEIAALALTDQVIELLRIDPTTITVIGEPAFVADFDPMASAWPRIAGVRDGEVVLSIEDAGATELRTADGATIRWLSGRDARVRGDGALVWIDGDTVWFEPSGGTARPVGSGFTSAWFATAG